jgi:hypothetical protein
MISWAIRRKYKGVETWKVLPHFNRRDARQYAAVEQQREPAGGAKHTVHKIRLDVLTTCGCRLIDDVPVTCGRHSNRRRES